MARRINGWGDDTVDYPLHSHLSSFLEEVCGPATRPHDTDLTKLLEQSRQTPTRLPDHHLISTEPLDRLKHARGQSFPDLIALRSGCDLVFPDGVAYPTSDEEVAELIEHSDRLGYSVIPYGGGTSVVGHINPQPTTGPTLTINLSRLNRLHQLDAKSRLATFGAGVAGPDLEAALRAQGYTLGHFPQSFELSTLGGWIATRSSGQQSLHYGRIEQLFAGGVLQTPRGKLEIPAFPASAAATDLREMVLGCEGHLGIISRATVRISALPEHEEFQGIFFPDFESGIEAVRQLVQAKLPLSMLRFSTPRETATTLKLAGGSRTLGWLEKWLARRGAGSQKCLLILGLTGKAKLVMATRHLAFDIIRQNQGIGLGPLGASFGKQWRKSRFRQPYLRNTLWEYGYGVDTVETATSWSNVPALLGRIETALEEALLRHNEQLHVFTHLSHLYPHGSSLYTTFLFRLATDPAETLERWQTLKTAASQAIVAGGGTISHQHGVGLDHAPYLLPEKGELGMGALHSLYNHFDPQGIMNPGKTVLKPPDHLKGV